METEEPLTNDLFDTDPSDISTTTSPPEFWSSENAADQAQIIAKRMSFTFNQWLYRVSIFLSGMILVSIFVGIPIIIALAIIGCRIKSVLSKKRDFYQDKKASRRLLEKELHQFKRQKTKKMEKELARRRQRLDKRQ